MNNETLETAARQLAALVEQGKILEAFDAFDQIALQTWRDSKIIAEKFYCDPAALAKR